MSNKSVANNKKYEITFGYFNENKDMQMEFPPKNAKKYNGLQEKLNETSMEIVANNYTKVLDKNGQILARVAKDGKVLTGKIPANKNTSKKASVENTK